MILKSIICARQGSSLPPVTRKASAFFGCLLAIGLSGCVATLSETAAPELVGGTSLRAVDARLQYIGESGPMTPFQWAVWSDARLFFVPLDGRLYPVRRNGDTVLESLPPKLSVTFLGSGANETVILNAIIAPQQISRNDWILEKRVYGKWTASGDYEFVRDGFVLESGEKIALSDFASVRFSPRQF